MRLILLLLISCTAVQANYNYSINTTRTQTSRMPRMSRHSYESGNVHVNTRTGTQTVNTYDYSTGEYRTTTITPQRNNDYGLRTNIQY